MKFIVVTKEENNKFEPDTVYLTKSNWDDYGFKTIFDLEYCDIKGNKKKIGWLRIGQYDVFYNDEDKSTRLPDEFYKLDINKYFSFSISNFYYEEISKLEDYKGYDILECLNDFVINRDIFDKAKNEEVTKDSLFRNINILKDEDRIKKYEEIINSYYKVLNPPVNLKMMRRNFGSTGWTDIDNRLLKMQKLLSNVDMDYDDYTGIASIGRRILEDLSDKVYNCELHKNENFSNPKGNESINKLSAFIDYSYKNKEISEDIKKYIKSTIRLVNIYVHKKKAEKYECFLCVHAVISLVYQIAIITNKETYNKENI